MTTFLAEEVKQQVEQTTNSLVLPYMLPGRVIKLYGYAPRSGKFLINIAPEYEKGGYQLDRAIALQLEVDVDTYHIIRRSFAHGTEWSDAETDGYSGLLPGRHFSLSITVQMYSYAIHVNGYHFATYYHRIPITKRMWITVDENINLRPIEYI